MTLLADIILPLALNDTYTYLIPQELEEKVDIGYRVIVPLRKNKYYTGIIANIHSNIPIDIDLKEIHSVLDSKAIVNKHQLRLWEWISFYYMAPLGDVYNAALPNQLKLESQAYVSINPDYNSNSVDLKPTESHISNFLLKHSSTQFKIADLEKEFANSNLLIHLNSLSHKGVISIDKAIKEKYKDKEELYISINPNFDLTEDEDKSKSKLTPRQLETFHLIKSCLKELNETSISRKKLLSIKEIKPHLLKAIIDKEAVKQTKRTSSWLTEQEITTTSAKKLSPHQQEAYRQVKEVLKDKDVCLLHGVTSSGKTEVYIHLIRDMLQEGKQILYLLPEIALTTQLTKRLQNVFGEDIAIYHSKINDNVRTEIWHRMLSNNPYKIIIGVRSSVFMPFSNLGLIVIDEEHDQTFRQTDPSPRYHGKNTAIMYAHFQKAKVLLGSATPSIESYYNTTTGKYGLVTLDTRFDDVAMPKIKLIDTKDLRRRKIMKSLLSPPLIEEMRQALNDNQQIILFRNRRGYAPIVECSNCAYIPKCRYCDVTLTYHKFQNRLKCHYCDSSYPMPKTCPECNENSLRPLGSGTEQLVDEVAATFTNHAVARLDTDTTRGKNSYEQILTNFATGKSQILVGTKMVSKGLDFDNVRVVGIIQADSLLNFPDFRSNEDGFQLITQASGRSGRKDNKGVVVIQTTQPQHPIYNYIINNDYVGFFNSQLAERRLHNYPPFSRLIRIRIRHKDELELARVSSYFADLLRSELGGRVLGPATPPIGRIQLMYINEILLKMELGFPIEKIREIIKADEQRLRSQSKYRYIRIDYETDV